jgi:hypothetical protein
MSLANDSILVTPGSGATVATELVSGKEHQVVMIADKSGNLLNSKDSYIVYTGNTAHVAAARTTLFDIFNATGSGKIMRINGVYIIPALVAVTGVGLTYEVIRTSAVGTGGTTLTTQKYDSANPTVPAQVTARTKPTGGATTSATLQLINGSSEETTPYASMASVLNHVPMGGTLSPGEVGWVVREGEGLKIDQTTNSAVGNVNIQIVFTLE